MTPDGSTAWLAVSGITIAINTCMLWRRYTELWR